MKELGEFLKETRINHGVSVEEASEDLNVTSSQLENIESGNVRAFQDVYNLKELVKNYAKYLGLDPNKVIDEFNDFLFEHTSKISLTDILEEDARRREKAKEEAKKKVISPYTKSRKEKSINFAPIILTCLIMLFFIIIIYLVIKVVGNERTIDTELKSEIVSKEEYYEFTY